MFSAIVAWAGAWCICRNAAHFGLLTAPNFRSSHVAPTATGGGVGIVLAGTLTGGYLFSKSHWEHGLTVFVLAFSLAMVGLWDDLRSLPIKLRVAVQFVVCSLFLFATHGVQDQGGLSKLLEFGFVDWQGGLAFSCLLALALWWVNLFNFMDGTDGLAALQGVFMLLGAAILALINDPNFAQSSELAIVVSLAAALAGFLIVNWPPAKVFMGDVGSTWIGFMLFALAVLTVDRGWLSWLQWLLLGAMFIADASVTLIVRFVRGEPWYRSHRSHAYQHLSVRWGPDRTSAHRRVALLFASINLFWIMPFCLATGNWPDYSMFFAAIVLLPLCIGAFLLGAGRSGDD